MRKLMIELFKVSELSYDSLYRAHEDYLIFLNKYGFPEENINPTIEEFIEFSNKNHFEYYEDGTYYKGK